MALAIAVSLAPKASDTSSSALDRLKIPYSPKNIINKIECCSVDNLQSLLSIIAAKMKSMIYQK
ncbi:hypothetical protein C3E96_028820 (plasmid) [Klebsiella pneumoniae]|nr:hypothetical protein C3E96_028820 [Klebsiella pneumoniae]